MSSHKFIALGLTCLIVFTCATHFAVARNQPTPVLIELQYNEDINYHGIIQVGTPAKPFKVIFTVDDRTSWLVSSNCTTPFCNARQKYNQTGSSTNLNIYSWVSNLYYRRGLKFYVEDIKDILRFDDRSAFYDFFQLVVNTEGENPEEPTTSYDGIIGLVSWAKAGVSSSGCMSTGKARLAHLFNVPQDIIAIYLSKVKPEPPQPAGHLMIGSIDDAFYDGQISYVKFESGVAIYFSNTSEKVENHSRIDFSINSRIFVDPTLKYVALSPYTLKHFAHLVNASKASESEHYRLATCDLEVLPELNFEIADRNFTITPEEYTFRSDSKDGKNSECFLGLTARKSTNDKEVLLGAAFLRKYYSVIDLCRSMLGFANSI